MQLCCGSFTFSLDRPLIMGVVNVTPDSFSDGGSFQQPSQAVDHALRLIDQGADILDVGGESTRPGAMPVPEDEELRRVMPVLEALVKHKLPVSIDTRKPRVMHEAIRTGAVMINDVMALREPGALETVACSGVAVCLMHMQNTPQNMQMSPDYQDVVTEVREFLAQRIEVCEQAGIERSRIVIDPGFGFGKTLSHNLELLRRLGEIAALDVAVLAGMSRKSMLGTLTGRNVNRREFAGVAAHFLAIQRGAKILRVHDVAAMKDALAVWRAVEGEN